MVLTNAFKEAVSLGNVRRIRIMMKDSLLNDSTFSEFNAMDKAACGLSGLYDTHDGYELNYNENTWDDSYMNDLMVQVVSNFSHERVNHLKEVVMKLRPVDIYSQESQSDIRNVLDSEKPGGQTYAHHANYQKQKCQEQWDYSQRGIKIAGGAIIGAAVGGVIAAAASVSIIGGAAIGAVSGAVVVTVVTSGE